MRHVEKPWGYEEIWAETSKYVGKILHVRQGQRLSLQHHVVKEETLRLMSGLLEFTLEDDEGVLYLLLMEPGSVIHVPPGRRHRMRAIEDSDLVEVSTPELDDVVRHEDDYGRLESPPLPGKR